MFQIEPPDLMHKRTRCTRIRIRTRTHVDTHRRNTSRQRNNYIGGNPLMYPEISASLSVSLPESDAKPRKTSKNKKSQQNLSLYISFIYIYNISILKRCAISLYFAIFAISRHKIIAFARNLIYNVYTLCVNGRKYHLLRAISFPRFKGLFSVWLVVYSPSKENPLGVKS